MQSDQWLDEEIDPKAERQRIERILISMALQLKLTHQEFLEAQAYWDDILGAL